MKSATLNNRQESTKLDAVAQNKPNTITVYILYVDSCCYIHPSTLNSSLRGVGLGLMLCQFIWLDVNSHMNYWVKIDYAYKYAHVVWALYLLKKDFKYIRGNKLGRP